MPRKRTADNPFPAGSYVKAKDSFSGTDEDGSPLNVSPNDVFAWDDYVVIRWPHHFKLVEPHRQRPGVEQATAAPGEVRG